MKAKLIGVRDDLLELAEKFSGSEVLSFGPRRAVCIDVDHMTMLVRMLRADAKDLDSVLKEA